MIQAFFATTCLVFLRAIQQLNVVHNHHLFAAGTAYLIAAAEIGVVLSIVHLGWAAVLWIGSGGAVGVVLAMLTHKQLRTLSGRLQWSRKQ